MAAFYVILASLIGIVASQGKVSSCAKKDSCTCTFEDGSTIDLKQMDGLDKDDKQPMFPNVVPTSTEPYTYSYKPCYSFDAGDVYGRCANVASCQNDGTQGNDCGVQDTAQFWEEGENIMIKYVAAPVQPQRETYVKLVCADSNSFEVQGELVGSNPPRYDYILRSPQACRSASGGGGLSVGTVLCIIFIVFIVVYIVGGVLFMKFRTGASGVEMVPNLAFWKQLPGAIKDGACFAISPITKSTEYSKI